MVKHQCPCGAKYKFEPRHAGKRATCKRCGAVFVVPAEEEDSGVIPIADEPLGLMDEVAAAAQRGTARPRPAAGMMPPGMMAVPTPVIEDPLDVPIGRGYVAGLVHSFLFASSLNNLITFVIMWFLLAASQLLLPWAGCLGLIGQFIIFGWYCTFRFNTIIEAAEGEPDLPRLTFTDGFLDDVLLPLLGWVGSWLIVLVPATVFFVLTAAYNTGQWLPAAAGGLGTLLIEARDVAPEFLALIAGGLFFWPIVALCISIGGFATLGRPDLIISTIVRTFPAYILSVLMVFGTVAAAWFIADAMQGTGMGTAPKFSDVMVRAVFLIGLGLYLDIVAMRSIGLYYHHFKDRFAWDWG
jgi:hypothetical protein